MRAMAMLVDAILGADNQPTHRVLGHRPVEMPIIRKQVGQMACQNAYRL